MTGLLPAESTVLAPLLRILRPPLGLAALACALLLACLASAQPVDPDEQLQRLTTERELLASELDQYKRTLSILQRDDTPPEQSSNPAVKKLAVEMVSIRERLIGVTEREVTLLQEQIAAARELAAAAPAAAAIEHGALHVHSRDYSRAEEAENVKRLHTLLANYYAELQESARTLPSPDELERRVTAQHEANELSRTSFSADKVHLTGAEGSTALTQITQRLTDPKIPESRRDIAPICAIRTRLFGRLIVSENRSLQPVGKNNYVARLRLQPGDTTLQIKDHHWEIQLPQNANATEFLITLYTPASAAPELHLFSIDDLLAEKAAHIPAWLPADLKLKSRAG